LVLNETRQGSLLKKSSVAPVVTGNSPALHTLSRGGPQGVMKLEPGCAWMTRSNETAKRNKKIKLKDNKNTNVTFRDVRTLLSV
jgi:hypothetical protein